MKTTRRTLYEEVWSTAMTTLARKYGLSDVGLAKICKKHDIPKPWPGYWARRYAGQKIDRTPLPNPKHDPEITIEDRLPDATAARRRANTVKPVVAVTETLRGAHPLVLATRNLLASRKPDSNGLVTCKEPGYLSACVSPASAHRAMLIMNSLIKDLESKHYIVTPCGEETETAVEIEGQRITVMIDEQIEKVQHEMPVDALTGPYTFHHSRRVQRQEPNGRLRIQIEPCEWLGRIGLRRTWNDGKTGNTSFLCFHMGGRGGELVADMGIRRAGCAG